MFNLPQITPKQIANFEFEQTLFFMCPNLYKMILYTRPFLCVNFAPKSKLQCYEMLRYFQP